LDKTSIGLHFWPLFRNRIWSTLWQIDIGFLLFSDLDFVAAQILIHFNCLVLNPRSVNRLICYLRATRMRRGSSPVKLEARVARWCIFRPKIQIWVNFGGASNRKCGIDYAPLVYFTVIWYIFPGFGILYPEKSGNPARST
jgi:hypothetical protein